MTVDQPDWRPRDAALQESFALWRAGRLEEALAGMQEAVDVRSADPDAWRGLGSVLWTLQRFEATLAAFQVALRLESWRAMHWANVGLALRDLHHLKAAANALEAATLLEPGYAPAWNELANVRVDQRRPDLALPCYTQALLLDPYPAVYHHNLGVALRLLDRRVEALASFRAALARDPGYHWTQLELQCHFGGASGALT